MANQKANDEAGRLERLARDLDAAIGARRRAGGDVEALVSERRRITARLRELQPPATGDGRPPSVTDSGALRGALVTDANGFADLRAEWNALLSRSTLCSPYVAWEWLYPWWQVFGRGRALRIVTVRDASGGLVGLAPLMLGQRSRGARRLQTRVLALIGSGEGPLATGLSFVTDPAHEERALAEIWGQCAAMADEWDTVRLDDICPSDRCWGVLSASALVECLAAVLETRRLGVAGVLPASFEACVEQMPSDRRRRNLRSALRRLQTSGHEVVYARQTTADGIEEYFDALGRMNVARLDSKGQVSAWRSAEFRDCLMQAALRMSEVGRLRLDSLTVDGRLAAAAVGFVLNGCYHGFQSAFSSEFAEHSPNHCLWAKCIEQCISEGLSGFDFGPGEHDYKTGYFSGRRPSGYLTIARAEPQRLWSLGAGLCLRGLRAAVRTARHRR